MRTETEVTGLRFDGRRVVGVTGVRGGEEVAVDARAGVILCAGALQSPKLMLLSGIGPAADLAPLGIMPRIDSPAVGRHLMEHPNAQLSARVTERTYNQEINSGRIVWHALDWLLRRRGPASSPYPHAVGFFRSDPDRPAPDIQLMFGPFGFDLTPDGVRPSRLPMITLVVGLSYPRSRGRLSLRSADWRDKPRIALEMLADPRDVADLTAGCRVARAILAQPAMAPSIVGEIAPGAAVQTDADWESYLRRTVDPTYHPVGTCRMAPDRADGVVDARLRVHGLPGLRVVDASVFPAHISGNTNAAVLMVAEKAADMILEQARG